MAKVFLILALISMFACSLVNMTGASRVLFAMSRDQRFIASSWLQKISSHHVPGNAIWVVTVFACFFVWIADSATALYGAAAVLFSLFYLVTVLSFARAYKKLPIATSFSLGRWHWPVVILAAIWLVIEIGILTIPAEFHSVAVATGSVLAVGLVLYLIKGRVPNAKA